MAEFPYLVMVLGARVELAHPCGRWILSPLRLPIPPSEHARLTSVETHNHHTQTHTINQSEKSPAEKAKTHRALYDRSLRRDYGIEVDNVVASA